MWSDCPLPRTTASLSRFWGWMTTISLKRSYPFLNSLLLNSSVPLCSKFWLKGYLGGDSTIFTFPADIHTQPNGFDFHSEEVEASNRFQLLETNAPVIPAASESVMTNQTSVNKPKKPSYTARKPRVTLYVWSCILDWRSAVKGKIGNQLRAEITMLGKRGNEDVNYVGKDIGRYLTEVVMFNASAFSPPWTHPANFVARSVVRNVVLSNGVRKRLRRLKHLVKEFQCLKLLRPIPSRKQASYYCCSPMEHLPRILWLRLFRRICPNQSPSTTLRSTR